MMLVSPFLPTFTTGMPFNAKGARHNFVPNRRRRPADADEAAAVTVDADLVSKASALSEHASLAQLAPQMWSSSYEGLFKREFESSLLAVQGSGFLLEPTSYRTRLKGEMAGIYDARMLRRQRDQMAIALHANNQRVWSASLMARSVCYFSSAGSFATREEAAQRRIASKPTTLNFIRSAS